MKIKNELERLPDLIVLYVIIHKLLKVHFFTFHYQKAVSLLRDCFF